MSGMPQRVDAERFVLGSILLDDAQYVQAAGVLVADDFSLEKHRRIFRRMGELSERGDRIDAITIYSELQKHGETESCDGLSYLISLDEGIPRIPNIENYVRIVREASMLRRIIFAAQNVMNEAMEPSAIPEELLTKLAAIATDLTASANAGSEIVSTAELVSTQGVDRLLGMSRGEKSVSLPGQASFPQWYRSQPLPRPSQGHQCVPHSW